MLCGKYENELPIIINYFTFNHLIVNNMFSLNTHTIKNLLKIMLPLKSLFDFLLHNFFLIIIF